MSIRALILLCLGYCLMKPCAATAQTPESWSAPRTPQRIFGNTWYIGTTGITVLLIRGEQGSILIDTGPAEALAVIRANLDHLGVELREIKLILTSHAHIDHVGGLAALKRLTGARVLASAASAELLAAGGRGDLHFGDKIPYAPLPVDGLVQDGESVSVGTLRLTAHATPAHTPGSTSWTWIEQDGKVLAPIAYIDSLTAPGYQLVEHPRYPRIVEDFRRGFAAIRALPCAILITPHPEASNLFARMSDKNAPPLLDSAACRRYADQAEQALQRQLDLQLQQRDAPAEAL